MPYLMMLTYPLLTIFFLIIPCSAQAVENSHQQPIELSFDSMEYCIGSCLESSDWQEFSQLQWSKLKEGGGFWMKLKLPDVQWKKPAVYIDGYLNGLEVYLQKVKIYQSGSGEYAADSTGSLLAKKLKHHPNHVILIPESFTLDLEHLPEYLYLKVPCKEFYEIGGLGNAYIGKLKDIILMAEKTTMETLRFQIPFLCLGAVLFFVGIISFLIFLSRWKERDFPFLSFGFFSLISGIGYLNMLVCTSFDIPPKIFVTVVIFCWFASPIGILAFVEQMLALSLKRFLRRLWQFQILFTLLACIWFQVGFIPLHVYKINFTLSIIYTLSALLSIYRFKGQRATPRRSSKIIIGGLVIFAFTVLIDLFYELGVISQGGYFYGIGTLILIISLGYELMRHYKNTVIEKDNYALDLERQKRKVLQLKQANLQSRFEALKSQVNPHFLFNTLGTLMVLIEEDQGLAVDFTQELSNVYRYLLQTGSKNLVSVEHEIDFIRSYTFLISKRFGKNATVCFNIQHSCRKKFIPPLSLQLLLENALKHNIISSKKPLKIEVSTEGNSYISVKNNLQLKRVLKQSNKIGLSNLKKQYLLYTKEEVIVTRSESCFMAKIPLLKVLPDWKLKITPPESIDSEGACKIPA